MTKHIDQQRVELLVRRDALLLRPEPRTDEMDNELDALNAALATLDEVAALGDTRHYPRVKIRLVPPWSDHVQAPDGRPWLVSVRHAADDDTEQVLGFAPSLDDAHADVGTYIAVQRFLADRLAHPHGAGL